MKIKTKFDIGEQKVFVVEKRQIREQGYLVEKLKVIRLTIDSGNNCMTEIKLNTIIIIQNILLLKHTDYLNVFKTEEEAKASDTVEDKKAL